MPYAHRAKAPDVAEELVLGEDPMRVRRERAEQSEFLVRKRHLAVSNPDLPPRWIDEQVPDSPRTLAPRVPAPQDRPDASRHLLVVKGLVVALFVWGDSGGRQRLTSALRASPSRDGESGGLGSAGHLRDPGLTGGCVVGFRRLTGSKSGPSGFSPKFEHAVSPLSIACP